MKIGVMLRTIDAKKGIGIYTQNLMDHLLPLDTKNDYVLFYYNSKFIGRYARYEHVQEKLIEAPLTPPSLRGLYFPTLYRHGAVWDQVRQAIWDQLKIPIAAKREGLDIIFSPTDSIPLLANCKTVMVLHGSEWLVYPQWFRLRDRLHIRIMMPLYCKKASYLLSNSNVTKRNFINILKIAENKIKTTHLAFDPRFKRLDDNARLKSIREKYSLPERFILYVGRIYPGKNFGNLIKAFSKIHSTIPHNLVVAGHPRWGHQEEFASVEKLGLQEKVVFAAWVPQGDLVGFYNLADAFILPSLYEAFGIPLLEAMACGCPVITSNTGAPPEITDGAALLVDPHNPDEIGEAIRKVLADSALRQDLSERGLHRAALFSWEKCARETLAVFESSCAGMSQVWV
jgi:glycosyltransferase involved in cell wall biosynthesis